ncbi:MAG: aminopeptidase P family protein [Erysipelotrichaceae bacterium]|nr:aminopeptidase P family protein [Erysipelotrichaceae bacterium]
MSTRRERILETMKNAGLDGLLFASGPNLQYVSECTKYFWQRNCMNNIGGVKGSHILPEAVLFLSIDNDCTIVAIPRIRDDFPGCKVITSYFDQMEDTLSFVVKGKRIGVGGDCQAWLTSTLNNLDPEIKVVEAELLLKDLRKVKDEQEIAQLRKLAEFTDEAIMYVANHFVEGMTMAEAEDMLMRYGMEKGMDDFSFPPTIGFKTRGTFTPEQNYDFPRTSKLLPNTGIAFDIGFVKDGYCSDWGRTLYWGKAPEFIKQGYKVLQDAQVNMINGIVPYKTNVNETYKMITDYVKEHGYGDYFRVQKRGMNGHQIGIDCHEFPMLTDDENEPFIPGMVFCSEPKLMFPGEMYMRVEDMILITEDGAESLSKFPRDMFEL